MKQAAVISVLICISGCRLFHSTDGQLWLDWSAPSYDHAFDPKKPDHMVTIEGVGDEWIFAAYDFGAYELLEIKCFRSRFEASPESRTATMDRCVAHSILVCRTHTKDWRSTFALVRKSWFRDGPAFYVRCMTPAEMQAWKPSNPTYPEAWERYETNK